MSDNLQVAAAYMLQECFEGRPDGQDYTWFVEGREAILPTLDQVDAGAASIKPNEATSSIAGHANHILYALRGANAHQGGEAPEGTWEDSWRKQAVTENEWNQLRSSIRAEYESVLNWYRTNRDWSDSGVAHGTVAMLPHMAFHLGAIQQIRRFLGV